MSGFEPEMRGQNYHVKAINPLENKGKYARKETRPRVLPTPTTSNRNQHYKDARMAVKPNIRTQTPFSRAVLGGGE